ncbi:MAG TPA: plastocyanin/azurin family copper-binding protein [Bryobacteraceae bacterium]|nr:plastocyanin/azurin family copper-binding protein [Bryobacteraceae bacterium]
MRKTWFHKGQLAVTALSVLVIGFVMSAAPVQAAVWNALVGVQSTDLGNQALAFLPSELWIHAGDSIAWNFATAEPHTVSFLTAGQIRPPFFPVNVGCPGTTPDGSLVTGASCVNSGVLVSGQTYTVTFPNPGNFKLVCLVHIRMTGAVHVLSLSDTLPHDQAFYDHEVQKGRTEMLSDASGLSGRGNSTAQRDSGNEVTAGTAAVVATSGGGSSTAAVMRFLRGAIAVHVGDTVEWTNLGPTVNHTVTFGVEPANLVPPSAGVTVDSDGARHAVVGSPTDNVNSGFLGVATQDRVGLAQSPLDVTRFRVTFTAPGTFNYICGLHDNLGMVGMVVVLP